MSPSLRRPLDYSTSIWQWSPTIRRSARGAAADRRTTASRPIRLSSRRGMSMHLRSSITTECSISLLTTSQPAPIGAERPDEAVDDARAGADGDRAADRRVHDLGAGLDHHPPVDRRRVVDRAVDPRLDLLEQQPVGLEQRRELPGVDPPALSSSVRTRWPCVDQPLDRVGDLQLAASRRLDRGDRLVDRGVEQVDADEGEVGRRVVRLLDQATTWPSASSVAMPKRCGSGTCFSRIWATGGSADGARRLERRRRTATRSCSSRLSPRYITKSSSPRNSRAIARSGRGRAVRPGGCT